MIHSESCINACNKLLRGEIAAIETYIQAMDKFESSEESPILLKILQDHQESATDLRNHVTEMGAVPETESGIWGTFAKAVEGTAKLLGDSPAITALKAGEEHGIQDYEIALDSGDLMPAAEAIIREKLLPRLREHVAILDGLPA